jgi:hypothetical protein
VIYPHRSAFAKASSPQYIRCIWTDMAYRVPPVPSLATLSIKIPGASQTLMYPDASPRNAIGNPASLMPSNKYDVSGDV